MACLPVEPFDERTPQDTRTGTHPAAWVRAWSTRVGLSAQTQGRTIEQAKDRVREAIAVLLDTDPSSFEILDDIRLSRAERKALDAAKRAGLRAADQAERAERATEKLRVRFAPRA
jgi:hypothetical protein